MGNHDRSRAGNGIRLTRETLVVGARVEEREQIASAHGRNALVLGQDVGGVARLAADIDRLCPSRCTSSAMTMSSAGADVIEIYSLRDALEALGARLAAERISPDRCRVLERVLQAMRSAATAGNRKRAMELDFEVHRTIIAMSGHRRLAEAYASLETQTRLFMAMTGRFHHDLSELVSIHEPLVAAICAGKAQRAFDLAIRHNEPDGRKLAQSVSDGFPPGLFGAGGRRAFPR